MRLDLLGEQLRRGFGKLITCLVKFGTGLVCKKMVCRGLVCRGLVRRELVRREEDFNTCAASWLARDVNLAFELGHDAMNGGEAHTRALARELGSEERLEEMGAGL